MYPENYLFPPNKLPNLSLSVQMTEKWTEWTAWTSSYKEKKQCFGNCNQAYLGGYTHEFE